MLPYQIEGSGHPLLLIHGWGVTHAVWHKLVPLLTPHFQLILVELPGAGTMRDVVFEKPYYPTCAEALEELRIALGIEQWAILAYSTGTRVCETYMQQYSKQVTRAVFLCPIYLRKPSYMLIRFFLKINAKHSDVVNWLLSDWRLYGWLLLYGFNLRRSDYINDWMNEIKLLPSENLKRVVTDLPGAGRAPFKLPISHLYQHSSFGACMMPLLLLRLIRVRMMRLLWLVIAHLCLTHRAWLKQCCHFLKRKIFSKMHILKQSPRMHSIV